MFNPRPAANRLETLASPARSSVGKMYGERMRDGTVKSMLTITISF